MQKLSPALAAALNSTLSIARRGEYATALERADAMLAANPGHGAIEAFIGMLCCQSGDLRRGIPHLEAAIEINPADIVSARNLVTALIDIGDMENALKMCTEQRASGDPSLHFWRLRGFLLQEAGLHAEAAHAYSIIVAREASDFESWNNMGNALATLGKTEDAIAAIERAVALRPDVAPSRMNLASAMINGGKTDAAIDVLEKYASDFPHDPKPLIELGTLLQIFERHTEALDLFQRALPLSPDDASLRVRIGEELVVSRKTEEAEECFHAAIGLNPSYADSYIQLASLFERLNRIEDLNALFHSALVTGIDEGALEFIRALVLRREQKFAEGLETITRVPPGIQPVRVAQLEGEFADRLNNTDRAFAAFTRVNEQLLQEPSDPAKRSEVYRSNIRNEHTIVTKEWYERWQSIEEVDHRPPPVFLVGFPRSGTTLLDTMLMGHSRVEVLEEKPPLRVVEDLIGGTEKIADLDSKSVQTLRDRYYEEAATFVDLKPGSMLVDKFPMHLNKVPVMHRLFPNAKFILALRHPYDVVLSCFITSFRLNNAMTNFLDLKTTAETYDLVFSYWEQCRSIIPIDVHVFRYESMVLDREAELRPLFDFLGLDWDGSALDHTQTASERGLISTASYSQVTEPIYQRATGRWQRYREHMRDVLPMLAPWAERLGYEA